MVFIGNPKFPSECVMAGKIKPAEWWFSSGALLTRRGHLSVSGDISTFPK